MWHRGKESRLDIWTNVAGFTTALLLHSPYFLRLGNSPCIEVRDLASGDILKTITDNYFSSLRSNGRFVAAPESQRNTGLRAGDTFYWSSYRSRVVLMDIQGTASSSIGTWAISIIQGSRNRVMNLIILNF